MKHTKIEVMCRVFLNDKIHNEFQETRVVYHDKKGDFVRVMGNKRYVENGVYEQHYRAFKKAYTLDEVLNNMKEKMAKEANQKENHA